MFYFLHGNFNKVLDKSEKIQESLLKKQPEASVFKINLDNYSDSKIEELLESQALFVQKYIVTVSRLLENSEFQENFLDSLDRFKESNNIFLIQEEIVDEKLLKKIEKKAEKVEYFSLNSQSNKSNFNLFDLAGLIGDGNKKKAWIQYHKALNFYPVEEIYSIIWWQVKTILIAKKSKNLAESGLKNFPYQKASQYLKNFNNERLENLATNLIKIYHESRLYGESLDMALEKLILTY
jgi:hypothetical protein